MTHASPMMQQMMRWFGPCDPVSLSDIRQAGCAGVVTALHHVPNGSEWAVADIIARRDEVEQAGLTWTVVESLPVHDDIKTRAPGHERYVEAYRRSLRNLAYCGIRTVTYNFMPVLDWTRTDLRWELPCGARALRFDIDAIATYDVHVLRRSNAAQDYDEATLARAERRVEGMDDAAKAVLERTIIAGLPGSEDGFSTADFAKALEPYSGMSQTTLADSHIAFLRQVCPLADAHDMRLVVHPDDPPFPLFGLPRVVSTEAQLTRLFADVANPSNGLCFCTGSLGVRADNDLPAMVRKFGSRIGFLHLRNTVNDGPGTFTESEHLVGSVDMFAVLTAVHDLSLREGRSIPMRPDHGHQMLDDLRKVTNPGYSGIGRLRGLAELRGMESAIARMFARSTNEKQVPVIA